MQAYYWKLSAEDVYGVTVELQEEEFVGTYNEAVDRAESLAEEQGIDVDTIMLDRRGEAKEEKCTSTS
jgi:hypothetical protein